MDNEVNKLKLQKGFFFLMLLPFTGRSFIYSLLRFHFSYVLLYVLRVKFDNMLTKFFCLQHSTLDGVDHLIKFFPNHLSSFRILHSWFECLRRLPRSSRFTHSRSSSSSSSSSSPRTIHSSKGKVGEGIRTLDPWRRVDKSTDLSVRPRRSNGCCRKFVLFIAHSL